MRIQKYMERSFSHIIPSFLAYTLHRERREISVVGGL